MTGLVPVIHAVEPPALLKTILRMRLFM